MDQLLISWFREAAPENSIVNTMNLDLDNSLWEVSVEILTLESWIVDARGILDVIGDSHRKTKISRFHNFKVI